MKVAFLGTPLAQAIKDTLAKHFTLVDSLNEADLGVVAAYGRILTKNELTTPKYGCINVHPSLLPQYRGPTPVQTAILNGDKKTGVTIIKLDEEVDHGPILAQVKEPIFSTDTSESLYKRLFEKGAQLLPKVLGEYIKGTVMSKEQDHSKATYTKPLSRADGYIDISDTIPPEKLDRMIRAYHPWPGVWTKVQIATPNKKQLTTNKQLAVRSQKLEVRIKFLPEQKIQVEGKKPMSYKDFINGYPEAKEILKFLT